MRRRTYSAARNTTATNNIERTIDLSRNRTCFMTHLAYRFYEAVHKRINRSVWLSYIRATGAAIDVYGDGIDELVVSLFFENRIAVIKCL